MMMVLMCFHHFGKLFSADIVISWVHFCFGPFKYFLCLYAVVCIFHILTILHHFFDIIRYPWLILCLGALAWDAALTLRGAAVPRPKPRFGHGALFDDGAGLPLLGTFHPSQQNTFTGRLTRAMLDAVFSRARALL